MGEPVSAQFKIVRHCKAVDVDSEANPEFPVANGSAFELRNGEAYLSVNCPEMFDALPDFNEKLKKVLSDLRTKPNARTIRASHWFAVLDVGLVNSIPTMRDTQFSVEHEREEGDESHCGIYGLADIVEAERMSFQTQIAACATTPAIKVSDLDRTS